MANHGILTLRRELGCRQSEMAEFLKISKQLLAHVEKDSRVLDMETIHLVAKMHNLITDRLKSNWMSPEISRIMAQDKAAVEKKLPVLLGDARHLLQKNRMLLDKMKEEYPASLNSLNNLLYFKNLGESWSAHQSEWIDANIKSIRKKINECNAEAQQVIEFEIQSLANRIETIDKMIGNKFDVSLETLNILKDLPLQADAKQEGSRNK
jgi:transcriptional regulator with XRE-family HTH domain